MIIVIGILSAIAVPQFVNQRRLAEDVAAKSDVTMIGREITSYFGDNMSVAALAVTRTTAKPPRWRLAGGGLASAIDLGRVSPNVVAAKQTFVSRSNWCVSVKNAKGKRAVAGFRYSASAGFASGACP